MKLSNIYRYQVSLNLWTNKYTYISYLLYKMSLKSFEIVFIRKVDEQCVLNFMCKYRCKLREEKKEIPNKGGNFEGYLK